MYLAENLKFLREQNGKTQGELAVLFGIEQKTISSWECGSRKPPIGTIVSLAKLYRVSLDDLVLTDMRPPVPVYALNLAYLRKKYGMTQQELVEIIGLKNKSSISLIENGKYEPSIENLEKLADFFGVTMDQIVKQDLSQEVSQMNALATAPGVIATPGKYYIGAKEVMEYLDCKENKAYELIRQLRDELVKAGKLTPAYPIGKVPRKYFFERCMIEE